MKFTNARESKEHARKKRIARARALQAGRQAYFDGKDGWRDNPYPFGDVHDESAVICCRFLLGWLREYFREHPST